jgi:peptidyl-prolyl cis-trans isomerase C
MKTTLSLALMLGLAAGIARAAQTETNQAASANADPAKSDKLAALFEDKVVAKSKSFQIKRSQLDEEGVRMRAQYAARGQTISGEQMAMVDRQILEQMIQVELIKSKATDADKVASKAVAEKRLADARSQLSSDEAFNLRLKAQGLTKDDLLSKWTDAAVAETVLKRELKTSASAEDAKKYYDEFPNNFETPEMVRASHILLTTQDRNTQTELPANVKAEKRKLAEELVKRARAGEDFAKLVRENSEDPGSKERGGEYTFSRGQMVKEFEAAAFSLGTNQVSDVVTTQFGYHVIKVSEKIPARKEPFNGLETKTVVPKGDGTYFTLNDALSQVSMQKQYPEFVAKLKQEAKVEILDEKLKMPETPSAEPTPAPAAKAEKK